MRSLITVTLSSFFVFFCMQGSALAEELSGKQIMQKVKDREDGDNSVMDMEMILIDRKGKKRLRKVRTFGRDSLENKKDSQSIMFFLSPADVKDTGFLTFDYDDNDRDDDQWLYLPELKKVKRIAASDKSGSFMGTDFTYADMSSPNIDHYDYTVMKTVDVNGRKTWQIESMPNTEKEVKRTGYTKSILFVGQDNFVVLRSINWVKKGKKLKLMDVKKLEKIDGIWTSIEVIMTTKKGKQVEHRTLLRSSNVKYNQALDDDLFTQRRLTKGL